jgi:hypothetical protein
MRKDLSPSTRTEAVRELGWRLGSSREAEKAGEDDHGSEPTQASGEGGQIMKYLEDWRRMYEDGKERRGASGEEAATSDDSLACAEERLAAKRAAELEERAKVIERLLPVIDAQLGILWNEVTGSGQPMPSEIQLTSTGTEMTTDEHVVTAETHLRYAEGHLQPSEEHLADAEVHRKLVKAHLAALEVTEPAEADSPEAAVPPPPEPASGKASAGKAEMAPEERDRSPAARPRQGLRSGGGDLAKVCHTLERGRTGRVLSAIVRTRQPTPWMNVKSSGVCRSPRGGRRSRSGTAVSPASQIAGTGRRAPGVTAGSGFGGITY